MIVSRFELEFNKQLLEEEGPREESEQIPIRF